MFPIMPCSTSHHHQIPIGQHEPLNRHGKLFVLYVAEEEVSGSTEGEGGYAGIGTEERLGVGVVGYEVGAGGVVVDEGEVVGLAGYFFHCDVSAFRLEIRH